MEGIGLGLVWICLVGIGLVTVVILGGFCKRIHNTLYIIHNTYISSGKNMANADKNRRSMSNRKTGTITNALSQTIKKNAVAKNYQKMAKKKNCHFDKNDFFQHQTSSCTCSVCLQ